VRRPDRARTSPVRCGTLPGVDLDAALTGPLARLLTLWRSSGGRAMQCGRGIAIPRASGHRTQPLTPRACVHLADLVAARVLCGGAPRVRQPCAWCPRSAGGLRRCAARQRRDRPRQGILRKVIEERQRVRNIAGAMVMIRLSGQSGRCSSRSRRTQRLRLYAE